MKRIYITIYMISLVALVSILLSQKNPAIHVAGFREFYFEETNNGYTIKLHVANTRLAEYIFDKKEYSETERVLGRMRMKTGFRIRQSDYLGLLSKIESTGFVNLKDYYVKDKELQGGRAGRFLLSSTKIEKTIRFNNYMPNGLKELRSYIIEYILFKYSGDIYKNAIRIK